MNYALPYGFAAARAYSAYGDQYFLDLAKGVWQFGLNWTITDAAIASGRTQGKNYTISTHCGDVEPTSMKGATFFLQNAGSTYVMVTESSEMMSLSALIAEAERSTSSPQYTQAHDTYTWIRSHLVDTTVNLVRNGVKIKREDNCELLPEFPVDGAHWFIRGLSVLKDIQATRDPEIEARWMNTIKGITTWHEYHTSDGVNIVGTRSAPASAAFAAYRRIPATDEAWKPMRAYLEAYMANQFNALLDKATIPGTDLYGISPSGPRPGAKLSLFDQVHGLTILFNGLTIPESTNATSTPKAAPSGSISAGAIAGCVIGSFVLLALIGLLIFFLRRRWKANAGRMKGPQVKESSHVDPFEATGGLYANDRDTERGPRSASPLLSTWPPSTAQTEAFPSATTGQSGKTRLPHSRENSDSNYIGFQPISAIGRGMKRLRGLQQQHLSHSRMTKEPALSPPGQRDPAPVSTPPSSEPITSEPSSSAPGVRAGEEGRPLPAQSSSIRGQDVGASALPTEDLIKELYERMHASGTEGVGGAPPGYRA